MERPAHSAPGHTSQASFQVPPHQDERGDQPERDEDGNKGELVPDHGGKLQLIEAGHGRQHYDGRADGSVGDRGGVGQEV